MQIIKYGILALIGAILFMDARTSFRCFKQAYGAKVCRNYKKAIFLSAFGLFLAILCVFCVMLARCILSN